MGNVCYKITPGVFQLLGFGSVIDQEHHVFATKLRGSGINPNFVATKTGFQKEFFLNRSGGLLGFFNQL